MLGGFSGYLIGVTTPGGGHVWLRQDGDTFKLDADEARAHVFMTEEIARRVFLQHIAQPQPEVVTRKAVPRQTTLDLTPLRDLVASGGLELKVLFKMFESARIFMNDWLDPDKPFTLEDLATILAQGRLVVTPENARMTHTHAQKVANFLARRDKQPFKFSVLPDDGERWIIKDDCGHQIGSNRLTFTELFCVLLRWPDLPGMEGMPKRRGASRTRRGKKKK